MKKIAILGSTGSIGTQTLDVVRANGDIEVLGISAGKNIKMLEEQAREFHPQLIAVWDENAAKDLAVRLQDMDVKIVSGMEGLGACTYATDRYSGNSCGWYDWNPSYYGGNQSRKGYCTCK